MGTGLRLLLPKMGGILGFAMEMTRRGIRCDSQPGVPDPYPRHLETRTQRGFPHFHSNDGCGVRFSSATTAVRSWSDAKSAVLTPESPES